MNSYRSWFQYRTRQVRLCRTKEIGILAHPSAAELQIDQITTTKFYLGNRTEMEGRNSVSQLRRLQKAIQRINYPRTMSSIFSTELRIRVNEKDAVMTYVSLFCEHLCFQIRSKIRSTLILIPA